MRASLLIVLVASAFCASGQHRRNVFPVWTYHNRNVNIHGVSVGIASALDSDRYTNTNGIKVEIIGLGLLMPLIPDSPIAKNDSAFYEIITEPPSEKINGFALSASGTACDCVVNGFTGGFVGQINLKVNGLSVAGFMNFTQVLNGVQAALFMSETYKLKGVQIGFLNEGHNIDGLQIGVFNRITRLRGIQIGLWNVNERRKLPLINWNFKRG
jgi:hypothetical protein